MSSALSLNCKSGPGAANPRDIEVWVRIAAFLSLKSERTQKTYSGIFNQWFQYISAEPNTLSGAGAVLAADDLVAISFVNFLTNQSGHKPRMKERLNKKADPTATRAIAKRRGKVAPKKDGSQTTLANSTIVKKVSALRRMYRMLINSGCNITMNPFDVDRVQIPSAKSGQKRPTEMISFEDVKLILNLPDRETEKGVRDQAILALFFAAGLRKSEVINLRMGDLRTTADQKIYFLRLRSTKNKKDADQPLPGWSLDYLLPHIAAKKSQGADTGDHLFTGYRGRGGAVSTNRPISPSGMHKLFVSYTRQAGANFYATPHSARATAITKLLSDGHSHKFVQKFSRHSSSQMVDVYDKRRLTIEDNPGLELKY